MWDSDMKEVKAIVKMMPIDLLYVGLPQSFIL